MAITACANEGGNGSSSNPTKSLGNFLPPLALSFGEC